jgi:hypothetical protein
MNKPRAVSRIVSGPNLSTTGRHQADVLADILACDGIPYTGIFTSTMMSTEWMLGVPASQIREADISFESGERRTGKARCGFRRRGQLRGFR